MKVIVISSSKVIENEARIITSLFEEGLESFHLRKHKLSTRRTKELINQIPVHYHNRIIIHSHHKLARKFKLKGIHLTKSHLKKKFSTWLSIKLIKLKNPTITISTSFNNVGQLYDTDHPYQYDYVFLSPIFDSLNSKFQGGFTEQNLKVVTKKTKLNVIARGGVSINSIEKANSIGFQGLAFYSCIWDSENPVNEFSSIIKKIQELGISIE